MSKNSNFKDKEMRCIHCGSKELEITEGILSCECGEEYTLADELGFLNYGQGGFETFSSLTLQELSEMMAQDETADSWRSLMSEPYHLGTGALEFRANADTLKELKEAVEWIQLRLNVKTTIHYATLHHRHGQDVYLGKTEEQLDSKLYAYVQEWWNDFLPDEPIPEDHRTAIEQYFNATDGTEYADYGHEDF